MTQGCIYINIKIRNYSHEMLLDSGTEVSAISATLELEVIAEGGSFSTYYYPG